jgi:hypothetical protein
MAKNQYVVEARVCDVVRSKPVNKQQANELKRLTQAKLGDRARIKIKATK